MPPGLKEVIRASEWWEYKLVPILAAFYATGLILDASLVSLWPAALVLLLSLIPGAVYVSVVNDVTDKADDLAAGKVNRIIGRSRTQIFVLLAIPVGAGFVFAFLWRRDPLLLSFYLAAWLAFSLYSLPPFRFKKRGLLGVLADASGAHLFPTLVAVVLAFRHVERPVDPLWLVAIGAWAFAHGLRGILWHQLTDLESDRTAGVRTFAHRHSRKTVVRLGTFVAFPVEIGALAVLLWQMNAVLPIAFLVFYVLFVLQRLNHWQMRAVVVEPKPRFLIVLDEYYDVFFPISVMIASSQRHPEDLIVLLVHLLLFSSRPRQMFRDLRRMLGEFSYSR